MDCKRERFHRRAPRLLWSPPRSNDKKPARLNAMRYILSKFEYTNKDHEVVGEPDPLIVKRGRDQIGD